MYNSKLKAGSPFPDITVSLENGIEVVLGKPVGKADWQLVVVYRGVHCPLCTKYLNQLESYRTRFEEAGVDIIAVSGDSREQLAKHKEQLDIGFPAAYGLTQAQMRALGLYISHPRSPQETDHDFAEPGLFLVNADGRIQVVDISNAPFARPDIETLLMGVNFIRNPENDYPIRGTSEY